MFRCKSGNLENSDDDTTDLEPSTNNDAADVEEPVSVATRRKRSLKANSRKWRGGIVSSDDDLTDVESSSNGEATDFEEPPKPAAG